ncbi:hypothetical protein [Rheinheimera sp.]|uniref:hypothetical protein n=1 Tax=Rheinheimera sp. TaxID=1869214 RepID=UPI002355B03B|nr:hypothetical protein [Rheinheimera sp.]
MCQYELFTLNTLIRGITDTGLNNTGATGTPQADRAVQCTGLAFSIIVTLFGNIVFQADKLLLTDGVI